MQVKKSKKADLENKKGLYLEIGLCISLLLVIGIFAFGQKEKVISADLKATEEVIVAEMTEITRQEDTKPPVPQKQTVSVIAEIINVVKDDAKITSSMVFSDFDEEAVVVQKMEVSEGTVTDDAPFVIVEKMPQFQNGGLEKFHAWVSGRVNYPQIAMENNIQGKVILTFVIERDGTLTNIEVLQSPDRSLSEEATRVLKTSPKWTPGRQRSTPVRVKFTLPIEFNLQ